MARFLSLPASPIPTDDPLQLDVFTLVPHAFAWLTEQRPVATVLGRELDLRLFSYRDYTPLRAGQVDDEPYGGGAGMVLRVDVAAAALESVYGGRPEHPVIVPRSKWPLFKLSGLTEVWRSRYYLIQVFQEKNGVERLSVCITDADSATGRWKDGISWESLQEIKRQVGRGDKDAVEVFPKDADVVNVANMRHLWVLPEALPFAWRGTVGAGA